MFDPVSDPVRMIPFGGCLLHGPLNPMAKEGKRLKFPYRVPGTYTFGEVFQAISHLKGEIEISPDIARLTGIRLQANRGPVADFSGADVALLELASAIEVRFRGFHLNRTILTQFIVHPMTAQGAEARKWSQRWFRIGLMERNEDVRQEAARKVLDMLPDDFENRELAQAVIEETRSSYTDFPGGFARFKQVIGIPVGVVTYVFQYMADGRAVSWPAGFEQEVLSAARGADVPVFEPSTVVIDYGIEKALRPDLRHYNDEFTPVMADKLVEFAQAIVAGAAADKALVSG